MGYRGKFVNKASMVDATNETEVIIENGVTSDFAISCWYPSPDLTSKDCHNLFEGATPIHLTEEGYNRIEVVFDKKPTGLYGQGFIDERDDWVIRLKFHAVLDEAVLERFNCNFTVFAYMEETVDGATEIKKSDIVCRGSLTVLPGPYRNE